VLGQFRHHWRFSVTIEKLIEPAYQQGSNPSGPFRDLSNPFMFIVQGMGSAIIFNQIPLEYCVKNFIYFNDIF